MIANATVMFFSAANVIFGITLIIMVKERMDEWETLAHFLKLIEINHELILEYKTNADETKEAVEMLYHSDQNRATQMDRFEKDLAHLAEVSGQRIGNLENQLTVLKRKLEKERCDETDD